MTSRERRTSQSSFHGTKSSNGQLIRKQSKTSVNDAVLILSHRKCSREWLRNIMLSSFQTLLMMKMMYNSLSLHKQMIKDYKIVTLCGSTRFKEQFLETQKRLTLEGYIVISVGLYGHSGDDEVWKPGTKEMLDDMHYSDIVITPIISVFQ